MRRPGLSWLAVLTLTCALATTSSAGVILTTDRTSFEANAAVLQTHDFDDFGPDFTFVSNPFTRGGVTYTSGNNLIVGTGTVFAPVQNMMFYNFWTPMTGTIETTPTWDMFGFDTGVASFDGSNSPVDVTVTTNLGSYSFNGLSLPIVSTGLAFLGFVTDTPGEYFTDFVLATQNGNGWAAGMTNVALGQAVPEPSSLALGALGALGLGLAARRRRNV